MSNKWADGHLLDYCAQCGKEIYVENIVPDEESDDETPLCSEDCTVKLSPTERRITASKAWRTTQ